MRRTKTTPPRTPTRIRTRSATPAPLVALVNEVGPRGVPTRRSFELWTAAALKGRMRRRVQVNLCIADAELSRSLNREFRGKDYATNVLSFPDGENGVLGDLMICHPVVVREAAEQAKSVRAHYAHMTVHGVLHLLGLDHELGEREALEMEAIERQVLDSLGFADPYA